MQYQLYGYMHAVGYRFKYMGGSHCSDSRYSDKLSQPHTAIIGPTDPNIACGVGVTHVINGAKSIALTLFVALTTLQQCQAVSTTTLNCDYVSC